MSNHLSEAIGEEHETGGRQEDNRALKNIELFGLCPGGTKKGDLICILYGCSVPVILRQRPPNSPGGWFELIGEAYVHGKMDGEAIADNEDGLTLGKNENFDLR